MNKSPHETNITIAGAGPVGALLAVFLGRAGYQVKLFESRPDSREHNLYQGKSINIALSDRGWLALEKAGIREQIQKHAIAMKKRIMHANDGTLTEQAYGTENQAIWSVSRAGINEQLLDLADKEPNIELHFKKRLTHIDFINACTSFSWEDGNNRHHVEIDADLVFAADGAYSKVRRLAQETPRFSYSQTYMPQCYIELNILPNDNNNADERFKLEKNALHIWPRNNFMLIALPNTDGSFTCTLFLNYESDNGEPAFNTLKDKNTVLEFFMKNFSDVMPLLENPIDEFLSKTANPLFLVNVDPWVINNKVALIGDAAHAMVPFYGQGMNCGFEDCRELSTLIEKHSNNWLKIFPAYQQQRKVNADAITELAKQNFIEMSELLGDANFLLRKKIEARFHKIHPKLWIPLYSMVTFSPLMPYQQALKIGVQQKEIMDEIMKIPNISQCWQQDFIYQKLQKLAKNLVY